MNYFVKTYGCQMNVHESEKLAGIFEKLGYESCADEKLADIIAFNTCCIRESAEAKIKGHIGELKRLKTKNPNLIIVICGCMTQQEGVAALLYKRYPFLDIIIGTSNLNVLEEKIAQIKEKRKAFIDTSELSNAQEIFSARTSFPNAWVNIIYGCNNFCTYCIVPYVRGRERSRNRQEILEEVESLVKEGYKEITLLGQNVNSYGQDLNPKDSFASLLQSAADIKGDFRIRFMTSHPKDLSNDLIDVIARNDKICKSIHLPVQSGSNEILQKMNRRYTRERYLSLIAQIRAKIPQAGITSDIIVGFPAESQHDFEDTLDLVEKVRFSSLFCFIYSKRRGTAATDMAGQIDRAVKGERIKRLLELQNAITTEISQTYEGKVMEILIDGVNEKYKDTYCGRTDCGRLVNVKSEKNLIGRFVYAKIKRFQSATLWGDLTEEEKWR